MAIIGIEKLYYSKITKDDNTGVTFETPKYLAGVKEIKISPKVNTDKLYAENILWQQTTTLDSIEVSVNLADLTNAEQADLLGHTVAAEGGIIKNAEDVAPYIALLYVANKSNGKKRYAVLYKGKLELPEDNAKGAEGKKEFQTPDLKATFQPLQNNSRWAYQVDDDDPSAPIGLATTWFNAVVMPGGDIAQPTVTTVPVDAATAFAISGNFVWTFNEAIDVAKVTAANFFMMKGTDGSLVSGDLTIDGTNKIVTFNPTADLAAATAYVAIATTNITDVAGNPLATTSVTNFTTA